MKLAGQRHSRFVRTIRNALCILACTAPLTLSHKEQQLLAAQAADEKAKLDLGFTKVTPISASTINQIVSLLLGSSCSSAFEGGEGGGRHEDSI